MCPGPKKYRYQVDMIHPLDDSILFSKQYYTLDAIGEDFPDLSGNAARNYSSGYSTPLHCLKVTRLIPIKPRKKKSPKADI